MSDLEVYKCFLTPSLAALVAILGWTVAHYFAQERDRKNRSKVLRNEYLISAYRTLFRVGLDRDVGKMQLIVKMRFLTYSFLVQCAKLSSPKNIPKICLAKVRHI